MPLNDANPPPTSAKELESTCAGLISITKVCVELVIVALLPPLLPLPILNELVET